MKIIVGLLVVVSLAASAQSSCQKHIKAKHDKMTGKTTLMSPQSPMVGKKGEKGVLGVQWSLSPDSTMIFFHVALVGNQCVSQDSEILMLFTDGTRQSFRHSESTNCTGYATFTLFKQYHASKIELFTTKHLESIRVNTDTGAVDADFGAMAVLFKEGTACLYELMK